MNLGAAALHSAVEGEQRQIHRQQQHHHDHRQSDGDDGLQHRQQAGGGDLHLVVEVFTDDVQRLLQRAGLFAYAHHLRQHFGEILDLPHALGNGAATLHLLLHLLHGQCEGVVADHVAGHIQGLGDRQTGRQHGGHAVGELCGGAEAVEPVEGGLGEAEI